MRFERIRLHATTSCTTPEARMVRRGRVGSTDAVSLQTKLIQIHRSEAGLSLVEELVAVFLVNAFLVLLTTMIFTGTTGVSLINRRIVAETLSRTQLEMIKDASYSPDPTTVPYPTVIPDPGYSVTVDIEYWIAPSGPFTTTLRNDGLQKAIVTVSFNGDSILQLEGYKVDR